MKKQLAMVIDSSKCIDCKGCVASCKVANEVPTGHYRNWIKETMPDFSKGKHTSTHFQPGGCMHCDNPTCVHACPTGATWKDEADGSVKIDRDLCIGCGNCIPACPYGARFRHPALRVADKCNYCEERRAHGLMPACVDTCPTKARTFGDINDPNSEAAKLLKKHQVVRVVNNKSDTKPNMYYIDSTGPTDWPHVAQMPTPMKAMTSFMTPALQAVVGLSGLGVLAMWGRQIISGPEDNEAHKETAEQSDES